MFLSYKKLIFTSFSCDMSQILKTLLTKIRKYYISGTLYKYFKQELKTFEIKIYLKNLMTPSKSQKCFFFLCFSRDVMIIFQKKKNVYFVFKHLFDVRVSLTPETVVTIHVFISCLLYTSPSPRDKRQSRMPSSA